MLEVVDRATAAVHPINGPVLLTLYDGPKNSDEIAQILGLDRSVVSGALGILKEYGLVKESFSVIENGNPSEVRKYYSIDQDNYRELQVDLYERFLKSVS